PNSRDACQLDVSIRGEFNGKEGVDAVEDLRRRVCPCDLPPQLGAIADPVSEPTRELLHFSNRVRPPRVTQVAEVTRKQIVAVTVSGLVIASSSDELLDLAKNPRIRACSTPDHYCVAFCLVDHAHCVLGTPNVAIANDRYAHSLFDCANQVPIRRSGIGLLTRSRMHRDGLHSNAFCHPGNFNGYDALLIPAGARLDRKWDLHGTADHAQQLFERSKIAQQPRTSALNYLFRRTAQIDIDYVEPEILYKLRGVCQNSSIGAKQLGRDRVLVRLEVKVVHDSRCLPRYAFRAREFRHDQPAAA